MAVAIESRVPDIFDDFLNREIGKELLRFTTAGSVDDGKSTLIGRLLHDCRAVYEDQLASVKRSPVNRSGKEIDFSLLTDGLRAEREQGITIDVAYRYFSTPRRKFIIADTPGHEQYTRNMATGASTADLAIILLDATKGVLAQTRRHAYIASLLGIPNLVAAINKMDLVAYREEVFARLRDDFIALADGLGGAFVECIPISALEGDNVVERSHNAPWYTGPTLLEHLEGVPIRPAQTKALRFPVQSVVRPDAGFRGFAGRVAGGSVRPGDAVVALPSERRTRVESIVSFDGELKVADTGESVVLKLAEEIDLGRGDMLVSLEAAPQVSARFAAMVVWLDSDALRLGRTYLVKHAGRYVKAQATKIHHRMDVNSLTEHRASYLGMNEIGLVEIETVQPLFLDPYEVNRTTGSLILIDAVTNATVGAAMVRHSHVGPKGQKPSPAHNLELSLATADIVEARMRRRGHRPALFCLDWQRAEAEDLERTLHGHGFEALLVNHGEIARAARKAFYATLFRLGIVVLAWNDRPIRSKDKALFRELTGGAYFESPGFGNGDGLRVVLEAAERLRLGNDLTGEESH